jgi:hypothetical protein
MNLVVSLVGVVIGLLAAVGIFAPVRVVGWMRSWHSSGRFWVAVLVRLVLGVLFILAAPSCRTPQIILALGVLSLVTAVGILALGSKRLDAMIAWWLDLSPVVVAVSFAAAAVFGCFLVYAGW